MSDINLAEVADPATPSAGTATHYVENVNRRPVLLDSKGVRNILTSRALPNWIRNSGFWFAQRQAPASATNVGGSAAARTMSADGWGVTAENANATYQRTDTNAAPEAGLTSRYYGNFVKITSTGKVVVTQVLEGSDATQLRGRTVRVTAWMKQIVGASPGIRLGLVQLNSSGTIDTMPASYISGVGANGTDPTLGTNLAYIAPKSGVTGDNCTANGNAYDCTLSSSWQRFSGVFDVPTSCKNLVVGFWGNAQFAATNGFALAQVSLTDGYEIQDWSPLAMGLEHNRVLRFYAKTFPVDSLPAQNFGVAGALRGLAAIAGAVATSSCMQWKFPVPMFKAPTTVTFYNPSAANAFMRNVPAATDATATSSASADAQGLDINATGLAGWTVGQELKVHVTADAEI